MILLYHKIAPTTPTEWWVSADTFDRQMAALSAFDVVHLADYDPGNPRHVVITFDGVYENVHQFAFPILRKWGYPFELFVTGDYIGGDNAFDTVEPLAKFCTIEQLAEMSEGGGRVQWHTASHRRLNGLDPEELLREIEPCEALRTCFSAPHLQWFAYPHGDHDDSMVDKVRERFEGALSCVAGNDSDRHQLNRTIVLEDTRLDRSRVTIIVANYNYGAYLPQAMESVLKQTVAPDEIILIDDASTDGSQVIANRYAGVARVVLNESNLGIVGNFNKAVSLASGDYIAFLGADNRMRCDYVERCKATLDGAPEAAVAYTDMVIFGARAADLATRTGARQIGQSAAERWPVFLWEFPEPTPDTVAGIRERNFIHGSSMYRRSAFDEVGGYLDTGKAEDHDLFSRMLAKGWQALRVPHALVEYRQHSSNQANTVLGLQLELARLAAAERRLQEECEALRARMDARVELEALRDQLNAAHDDARAWKAKAHAMQASRSWQLTKPLRLIARMARYGLVDSDRLRVGQALRTLYQRTPMPASVRRGVRTGYHWLRRIWAGKGTAIAFHEITVRPSAAAQGLPDYVIWGVIDWHFRHQRPQHLAQAIAATGRRVFYVSANLEDQTGPGFSVEPLDESGRLFQIRLYVRGAPLIYHKAPDEAVLAQLRASAGELLDWANCRRIISVVQHSFWYGVASLLPNSRLVYDCMDHHEGFGNNDAGILALEQQLLRDADLTITTSGWLAELLAPRTAHCHIVRNAGDYQHFARVTDTVFRDPAGRKVIGYIGAIAEWFDLELVEKLARRFVDCLVLLVGNDSAGAGARLRHLSNVQFTGELPYKELPFYVHGFDVSLLPFRIVPLTLATNPVKVYEYLGAGKPVVATALPETRQFGDLIETAATHDEFLDALARALAEDPTAGREARQAFAREQTWRHRARDIVALSEAPADEPLVSVIVVTYNNLALTQACLASLDAYSDYAAIELIVVDNASADGSQEFLRAWAEGASNRKLLLNAENRGFAAGNNQGLAIAQGEYLILLNNDTHVTPGWVRTLVAHMRRDASIGLIGPVTNNIGNEAKIDIAYDDMSQMLERSAAFTRRHLGVAFELPTAAFFCVAMTRAVYEKVGPLDEAFGRGFFEDDDYCRRVEKLGLRVCCAEDVFIHHHLSASFNKLKHAERQKLFEQNKQVYEAKWGPWKPHAYRIPGARNKARSGPLVFGKARN